MSRTVWLLPLAFGFLLACDATEPTAVAPDEAAYQLEQVAIQVGIDIQPIGQPQNVINTKSSSGHLTVAVLSTGEFDATAADYATVAFLAAPALHWEEAVADAPNCPERFAAGHFRDVNADGVVDALFHFDPALLVLPAEAGYCLYGNLRDGGATSFGGCANAVVR